MVVKCSKCGHLVDNNYRKCLICGSEIDDNLQRSVVNNNALRIMYAIAILLILATTWSIWGAFLFPERMPNVLLYSTYDDRPASFELSGPVFSNRKGKLISLKTIENIEFVSSNVKTLRIPAYATYIPWNEKLRNLESISKDKRNSIIRVSDDGYAMWYQHTPNHTAPDGIHIVWEEPEEVLLFLSRKKDNNVVIIPDGINTTTEHMYEGCDWLTQVEFPSSMKKISYMSFMGCLRLKKVIIPGGVTDIESSAFAGCDSLRIVAFEESNSPLKISIDAFSSEDCYFYFKRSNPPEFYEGYHKPSAEVFPNNPIILVPYEYYNAYYSKWTKYARSIIPVIETDGELHSVSFSDNSSDGIDDGRTTTSGGVSVSAPQTVWLDENFSVSYLFSGKVEEARLIQSDSFDIVSGPQKKVKSEVTKDSRSQVIEYVYIFKPKQAGVYALPKLRALHAGEEVFTPERFIEVMNEKYK